MPQDLVPPELLERFRNGDCIFFIGAGVSTESGLILGRKFKELLITEIDYPRQEATLSKVAQAYEDAIDRASLLNLLVAEFGRKVQPARQSHHVIAQLAKQDYCTHIVTTNYDCLLENALDSSGCEYHVSKRDSEAGSAGNKKLHLVKFHGSVNDIETLIISEADYRGFFRKRPVLRNLLGGLLVEKTFIFVGYSLEDPDFDQIYHDITTALGDFQRLSYAVQHKPHDFSDEQWHKFHIDPWTRRKIRIITGNAFDFLTELQAKLQSPSPAISTPKKPASALLWEAPQESPLGEAGQIRIAVVKAPPILNCSFETEFRMDDDGGDSKHWFGVRLRGVTSYLHAGYLVYLRSNGNLDISSVEEHSVLGKEIPVVDPKEGFVHIKASVVGDQIMVWINGTQIVNERIRLVAWPGRVYLHAFGSKVTMRAARLFEEKI